MNILYYVSAHNIKWTIYIFPFKYSYYLLEYIPGNVKFSIYHKYYVRIRKFRAKVHWLHSNFHAFHSPLCLSLISPSILPLLGVNHVSEEKKNTVVPSKEDLKVEEMRKGKKERKFISCKVKPCQSLSFHIIMGLGPTPKIQAHGRVQLKRSTP